MNTVLTTSPRWKVRTPVSRLASRERSSAGTLEVSRSPLMVRSSPSKGPGSNSGGAMRSLFAPLDEGLHPVDGHGEDDGGVLLRRDLGQGLQVAQVQGHGLLLQGLRGLGELLAGLELPR